MLFVEQELPTLPEHMISHPFRLWFMLLDLQFCFYVLKKIIFVNTDLKKNPVFNILILFHKFNKS